MNSIQLFLVALLLTYSYAELEVDFYANSCNATENIVKNYVEAKIKENPDMAASLIRLQFHDCFVRGCDASILLDDPRKGAEKDSIPNQSIKGYDFIEAVKSLLEEECPGVVSCADIISLVTREAIVSGGPYWKVGLGRKDGRTSISAQATVNLPSPFSNYSTLVAKFGEKKLTTTDLIILSGAHTIGFSQCSSFSSRLYNFTGVGDQDPSLNSQYATYLKSKCKNLADRTTKIAMDPSSSNRFDLDYYKSLLENRGLFQSDAALVTDPASVSMAEMTAK
ncbi:peroxidase [Ranunculus cassubicifolius]